MNSSDLFLQQKFYKPVLQFDLFSIYYRKIHEITALRLFMCVHDKILRFRFAIRPMAKNVGNPTSATH